MRKNENPKFFGHQFRLTWNDILVCLGCIGLGILLVVFPQITEEIVMVIIGCIGIVIGISYAVRYAMLDVYAAIDNNALVMGLVWIAGGILVCVLRKLLVALLPVLLGFFILYCGLTKLHQTLNLKRMGKAHWFLQLINAALSVIVGIVTICDPFTTAYYLMRFLGIALIVEGILDFVSKFIYMGIHDRFLSSNPANYPHPQPEQAPAAEEKEATEETPQ